MKYYDPITGGGIIDDINNICGTTNESYPNRRKINNINEGLDQYFHYASGSAPQNTFDDTNNTSAPIETQDLVDGTNAYKMSDFTNEILGIVKIAVLNADGIEEDLVYEDAEDIVDFLEDYSTDTGDKGQPHKWTKKGDYIYISPTPDYAETGGLRAYVNRELTKLSYVTFTTTIATPGVATATAHGLSDGDTLLLVTDGALPTGLTAETTPYYVSGKTNDTFKFAATPSDVGATEITTSGSQSGTHQFVKVNGTPGIPVIHHNFLAKYASKKFINQKHPKFAQIREDLAIDKQEIEDHWESMLRPGKTILETATRAFK